MANTYLEIRAWGSSGAWFDMTPYIAYNGLKQSRNDIDAPNSGRDTQDGLMHRARVAVKKRIDVNCRMLLKSELNAVLSAVYPEWLQVRYIDDTTGVLTTKKMYSNNISSSFLLEKNGKQWHSGVVIPLIEQ